MVFTPSTEGNKIANLFPFEIFCKFLDQVNSLHGVNKKKKALSLFVQNWVAKYDKFTNSKFSTTRSIGSFYPALRLLLPSIDYARPAYCVGEPTMARLLIKAFGLAPKGPDALQMLKCYAPRASLNLHNKDLADLVFGLLKGRCVLEGTYTLSKIHDELDALAAAVSQEEKCSLITSFVRKVTILELKWFVRIVSRRDLSLGLGTNIILSCLHPAAPAIWNVTQDLSTVCLRIASIESLTSSADKICDINQSVKLYSAFKPMLCSRANSVDEICMSFQQLVSKNSDLNLCLEAKYDGERVQLHKSGSSYRYWSRSGREWSSSYGEDGESLKGSLTHRLHLNGTTFASQVNDCILDGEMLSFDAYTNKFVTKATGQDVKRPKDENEGINSLFLSSEEAAALYRRAQIMPCFIVFDIIYLNGKLLTDLPLRERKQYLLSLFPSITLSLEDIALAIENAFKSGVCNDIDDYFENDDSGQTRQLSLFPIVSGALYLGGFLFTQPDKTVLMHFFDSWIQNGTEGLVAKAASSSYVPGGRSRSGWWKLKPDYVLGLCSDLDCLIVGAYIGPSSTASAERMFSTFLCAILNDEVNSGIEVHNMNYEVLPRFLTFCQVTNGLKRDQLASINGRLKSHWKEYDRRHINSGETEWLRVTGERPDFWIPPRHSIVLQIHAAEMTPSVSYAAGYTLRFPRVTAIREDKNWQDVTTMKEIKNISNDSGGRLMLKRAYPKSDDGTDGEESLGLPGPSNLQTSTSSSGGVSLRRVKSREKRKTPLGLQPFASLDSTEVESNTFSGIEFCLHLSSKFSGLNPLLSSKAELETAILKMSGTVVQNAGPNTTYIIADQVTAKVSNLIEATRKGKARGKEGGYDILKVDWLLQCIETGQMVPLSNVHVFVVRPSTQLGLSNSSEAHGHGLSSNFLTDQLFSDISVTQAAGDERLDVVTRLRDGIPPEMVVDGNDVVYGADGARSVREEYTQHPGSSSCSGRSLM